MGNDPKPKPLSETKNVLTHQSLKTTKPLLDPYADSRPHTTANKPPTVTQRTVDIGNRSNIGGKQDMGDVQVTKKVIAAAGGVAVGAIDAGSSPAATEVPKNISIANNSNNSITFLRFVLNINFTNDALQASSYIIPYLALTAVLFSFCMMAFLYLNKLLDMEKENRTFHGKRVICHYE